MNESSDLRKLLLAYRLGELSRDEREALDERIIGDRELSDRLAEAEYDLLDDYRAGRLAVAERSCVKRGFLPSERTRMTLGAEPEAAVSPATHGGRSMWLALATAAALLLVTGVVLFTTHFRNSRGPASIAHSGAGASPAQSPSSPPPRKRQAPVRQESAGSGSGPNRGRSRPRALDRARRSERGSCASIVYNGGSRSVRSTGGYFSFIICLVSNKKRKNSGQQSSAWSASTLKPQPSR